MAGFEAWGIKATVNKTIGMFAFAVWDKQSHALTLVRDRVGEKPLYYGWQNGTFLFASELKAIQCHPAFGGEIDRHALAAYMQFGNVPAPQSIYRDIKKLLPGTLLTITLGNSTDCVPTPFWSLFEVARNGQQAFFQGTDDEALTEIHSTLSAAVSSQQLSDVPIGALLSGGIDSSLIVALMQAQAKKPIHTFTIGFDDPQYNEADAARLVAKHLGTHHTELIVTTHRLQEVIPLLPILYDEPFADSSAVPTFLVSQLARCDVTVSLTGDGGDELFGGYNRYGYSGRLKKIPKSLRAVLARLLKSIPPDSWDRAHNQFELVMPRSLQMRTPGDKLHKLADVLHCDSDAALYEHLISQGFAGTVLNLEQPYKSMIRAQWQQLLELPSSESKMMALDGAGYLPNDVLHKVDRASMGVSLETRIPFLDHRVIELAWRLPNHMKFRNGQRKWILRQLLHKFVPSKFIDRPKAGFSIPIGDWLRGPLRDWAESLLGESRLRHEGYFDSMKIRNRWAEHLSGKTNWQHSLWTVLMFQVWLENQNKQTSRIARINNSISH